MVKPKNASSAYAICYNKAVTSGAYYWFTSSSDPLPFCKNTIYNPAGAFGGDERVKSWKGFECDCQPGNSRKTVKSGVRVTLTCEDEDVCKQLNCGRLGEGWICSREERTCVCDRSKGYVRRQLTDEPFCTKDECTEADNTQGPISVKKIEHRNLIRCNVTSKTWIPVSGYRFLRDNKTNELLDLQGKNFLDVLHMKEGGQDSILGVCTIFLSRFGWHDSFFRLGGGVGKLTEIENFTLDIDECKENQNYCCDKKKAQCESHGGSNKCSMKCENYGKPKKKF